MRHHILVAGVDFEFKGVDFRIFCNNRTKRVIATNRSKEDLTFQIFDVRRGEVVTHAVTYPDGRRTESRTTLTPSPFTAITKANYDRMVSGGETHYRFKNGQRDTMSILDVYDAVKAIGVDAPGTLVELSFFSHAFHGGPILANSYDDGHIDLLVPPSTSPTQVPIPSGQRDPDDVDPRSSKDFVPPTMDARELDAFRKAFHSAGFAWIWGCTFPRVVHEVLTKVERHPQYKDSGVSDDTVFVFTNFTSAHADLLEMVLRVELGGRLPDRKRIELPFRWIKLLFCRLSVAGYAHGLARGTGVSVYSCVVGTYAEYDSGALPLMSVHRGFARHFTFYKNYLGFSFDPERRGYGAYRPDRVCTSP